MSAYQQNRLFWGSVSPLANLTGGGLLIMASSRLSFALTCAGALLWVYGLSALISGGGKKIFPRKGKSLALIFLSSFVGSLYLLALWFASPVLAMENFFILSLVPLMCAGSGIFDRIEALALDEAVTRALGEAAVLGGLIIAFSLIREPLGYLTLSLPGGFRGIVQIFSAREEIFLPVRIISGSSGALLILGYGISVYRRFGGSSAAPGEKP
jgi:hypothetical protein